MDGDEGLYVGADETLCLFFMKLLWSSFLISFTFFVFTLKTLSPLDVNFMSYVFSRRREQALLTARRDPVLTRERAYERIRYPNVYDVYAEATKMPAFVGGARVRLE